MIGLLPKLYECVSLTASDMNYLTDCTCSSLAAQTITSCAHADYTVGACYVNFSVAVVLLQPFE